MQEGVPQPAPKDWLSRTLGLAVFALLAVLWVAFYTSPRGFDLLDSGCYYLEYAFPQDSADTHTSYRFFASPIYYLLGESIVAFRWVSWLFVWGAAAVMAWGWQAHWRTLRPMGVVLPLTVTVALFLHGSSAMHTIKPAALTYNSLNLVGMFVALGLFLAGTAQLMKEGGRAQRIGFAQVAAAAVMASVDFFIKPTTSAYLLAAFVVYLLVSPAIAWRTKKTILLIAAAGIVLGVVAVMVVLGGPGALGTRLGTLVGILKNSAYMEVLLTRTGREFKELFDFLLGDLKFSAPVLVLTFALGWGMAHRPSVQRRILALGGAITVCLWVWRLLEAQLWRGSHQLYMHGVVARFYLSAMVLGLIALAFAWAMERRDVSEERRTRRVLSLLIGLLVLAPFAGAFGSTTTMYLNGALYSTCWLAVTLIALLEVARVFGVRWHLPLVLIPTVGFSIAQLVHGQIVMPYMNPKPLWEQTEKTAFGLEGATLKVDPPLHAFIEDTRVILEEHGFHRGDDIFCFFNIPGLVYAVGGRSPIIPWYFGRIYVEDRVEEWHMQHASEERRRTAWVITQADAVRFREHYLRGGVDFPDGYDRIGTLTNPITQMEVGIWKPKARP